MQHLLDKLNPQQRAAVESVDGPLLILAGAGSGKTRVITHRIAYLIQERNVAPDSILAVTFTNKAAAEMAERVDKLLGHRSLAKPLLATFHSFCVRLLRRDIEALRIGNEGLTRNFVIYDETDQQAIVKQAMRRMGLDNKQLTPRTVLSAASPGPRTTCSIRRKFTWTPPTRWPNGSRTFTRSIARNCARPTRSTSTICCSKRCVLLRSSGEVRERYNRRYRYLLIDEYQDTNRPQYELMKLLAGTEHNVCVVGDEDQSIYSWRGADIRNILEFEKDFPEAKTIRLEQNYRSTQMILEGACAVVARNTAAQRQEPLDLARRRIDDRLLRSAGRGKRGAVYRRLHPEVHARRPAQEQELPRAPCSIAPTRSRAWWKKRCAATESRTPWSAASRSMTAPRSRTCSAI